MQTPAAELTFLCRCRAAAERHALGILGVMQADVFLR